MTEKMYQPGENYNYPLIIKKLLNDSLKNLSAGRKL
jgi:hypothetical protein